MRTYTPCCRVHHHHRTVAAFTVLAVLLCAAAVPATDPPAAGDDNAAAGSLRICLATAADHSPVFAAATFALELSEISAAFDLGGGHASIDSLTSIWVAVDVGDVAPPNYEMARAELATMGERRGRFRYSQNGPLPPGRYRVDVLADGAAWKSAAFEIAPAAEAAVIESPAELLPLRAAESWPYDFVQEIADAARSEAANEDMPPPDAKGIYRARVQMRVVSVTDGIARLELRRDGEHVATEFWRVDQKGLAAVAREIGDERFELDPPQLLWPLPLGSAAWTYRPRDGSFTQRCRMWGPLELETGEKAGYIVFTEQTTPLGMATAERHFVPGVGMVREVIITVRDGQVLSRQEMSLQREAGGRDDGR